MAKFGKAFLGFLAQNAGALARVAHDTVGNQWQNWTLKPIVKLVKPSGISYDPKTGKMLYTPRKSLDGLKWSKWGDAREIVGDYLGRAYNKADFLDRGAKYLDNWGTSQFSDPRLGKALSLTTKGLAWGGLGTGLLDMGLEMTGNEDSSWYGLGKWNPYQWIQMGEYSPTNLLFNYTTPAGLGLTAVGKGITGLTENVTRAASEATIDQTARALAEMDTMGRLAYLFSPTDVTNRYKARAMSALDNYLKSSFGGETTGDELKDKALRDVAAVKNNSRY